VSITSAQQVASHSQTFWPVFSCVGLLDYGMKRTFRFHSSNFSLSVTHYLGKKYRNKNATWIFINKYS